MMAPARVPRTIVAKLNAEANRVRGQQEVKDCRAEAQAD